MPGILCVLRPLLFKRQSAKAEITVTFIPLSHIHASSSHFLASSLSLSF